MAQQGSEFHLEKAERREIEKLRRKEKDGRLRDRLAAILWLDEGRTLEEVASLLGVDVRTIRDWLKTFKKKGEMVFSP
jgi:transposase